MGFQGVGHDWVTFTSFGQWLLVTESAIVAGVEGGKDELLQEADRAIHFLKTLVKIWMIFSGILFLYI